VQLRADEGGVCGVLTEAAWERMLQVVYAHLLPELRVLESHILPKAASMVHDRLVLALRSRCCMGSCCSHEGVRMGPGRFRAATRPLLPFLLHLSAIGRAMCPCQNTLHGLDCQLTSRTAATYL
jgi:hypothetical protein